MHDAATSHARWALFLDVDGTLLEVAATPESVYVSEGLKILLNELSERLGGALALISGRTIEDLDRLFAPLRFCASGVHGAERREANGRLVRAALEHDDLREAHAELMGFVRAHDGLLLEDKSFALALHYRLAPHLEEAAHELMRATLERLGSKYLLQPGKRVLEIRPAAWSKGTAVRSFLQEAPFAGRAPIYIGDDVTDEHAFEAVNELQGLSVRVGDAVATRARFRLPTVTDVHKWLSQFPPPAPLMRAVQTQETS
jgi:trehalose 6-phosphate phosphatase